MTDLPRIALSVRPLLAWAIIHAGRDCENRGPLMIRHLTKPVARRIAVHAARGLTRAEYQHTRDFMASIGVVCPPPNELLRGGIIGSVDVTRVTKPSLPPQSRWYFGPRALMLANPLPCEFIPAVGDRGYFEWRPAPPSIIPKLARWMQPVSPVEPSTQLELIEDAA